MKPIRSQKKISEAVSTTLLERGIALITGRRNGKTISQYALMESHTTLEDFQKLHPIYYKQPKLVFCEHVRFPPTHKISPEGIMRMVLGAMGVYARYMDTREVRVTFADEMMKAKKNNVIFVVPMDNAENLHEKAYSAMKELNEFRYRKEDVGLAFVISGQLQAMYKMPPWFSEIATEYCIDKAAVDEIADIMDELYPKEKHLLYPFIATFQQCGTTGIMKKKIKEAVIEIRSGYIDDEKTKKEFQLKLEQSIVKINEQMRLAA
jgi:hypothetical protein